MINLNDKNYYETHKITAKSICDNVDIFQPETIKGESDRINRSIIKNLNTTVTYIKLMKIEPSLWIEQNEKIESVHCDTRFVICYEIENNQTRCYQNSLGSTLIIKKGDYEKWN